MNFSNEIDALFTIHGFASLVILSSLELVLGIDNIIFIALVIAKLPENKKLPARATGLGLALLMRIAMLFLLVWLSGITHVLFTVINFNVSVRDILFFIGGAYLTRNTFLELRAHIKKTTGKHLNTGKQMAYRAVIAQIVLVDMLFSFDSIFTAIGLMQNFVIMAMAVVLGMVFMLWLSGKISVFINNNPTIKTIALGFIIAVGLLLITSAFHIEIDKKYVYLAFFAAFAAEMTNIQIKKKRKA